MNEASMKQAATTPAIGKEQLKKFLQILEKYKNGKYSTEKRIVSSENWWKLRNEQEEAKDTGTEAAGFKSQSAWLHNVIVSKHADAMEAYPEPNMLPREEADKEEAERLSNIVPCILEQNKFEETYSDVMWQKLKTGTGVYKIVWDQTKLNGLGDIHIERANLLNIYWEPGVTDIQKSPFFFHTEMHSKQALQAQYPQLAGKLKSTGFLSTKFLYDDKVDTTDKATVIEVYYHKIVNGKNTLQYCQFVEDEVLFATENMTQRPTEQVMTPDGPAVDTMGNPVMQETGLSPAETGLYDHGKYPYVFDTLFPYEGSPCGYGFVDLCRNPQTLIDLLNTAFVNNARVGAIPRYFSRIDGNVNEKEFLDMSKPLVRVSGNVDEASLRRIEHNTLDGNYIAMLDRVVEQLRQTSGNTEAATGQAPSGVTTASGIAALQEASGKGSRDSTKTSWRAFNELTEFVIELMRQFYDVPRQFRIVGQYGMEKFATYSNEGLQPQHQGKYMGMDMGYRLPVFDIKISAQKKNVYTKVAQNELALQLFKLGFFNPQMATQVVPCLEMMDFDGKDKLLQKIAQNGDLLQKLVFYLELLLPIAPPELQQQILQDYALVTGGQVPQMRAQPVVLPKSDAMTGKEGKEHGIVRNAREQAQNASQPDGAKEVSP